MIKEKKEKLTVNEFVLLGLGASLGSGFLKLPNAIVDIAKQDSWISAIIGLIYPLYIVIISLYIIKKHPKENILVLSQKYFGKFLGNILNIVFMFQFLFYTTTTVGDYVSLSRTYIVAFLTPEKIILVGVFLGAYCSYKGLKVTAKVNSYIVFCLLATLFSLSAINNCSILNIKPIFGAGITNILKGSIYTSYSYYGWEILLLFHPFVSDLKSIKKSLFKTLGLVSLIWVWMVFITIFFLGIDIIPKNYWSVVVVFESIQTQMINNFRYVFMLSWILLSFRSIAIYYYSSVFQINYFTKISTKTLSILIFPFIIYFSVKISNNILRADILDIVAPVNVIINLIWITSIALLSRNKQAYN